MKLKRFLILLMSILVIVSVALIFTPLLEAFSQNSSLVQGAVSPGATYSYEMDVIGGQINFYRDNSVSNLIGNSNFTNSYINVTMDNGYATFSVKLFSDCGVDKTILADSFVLKAGENSKLLESFFPSGLGKEGGFVNVFNNTGQYNGTSNVYSEINVGRGGTLYSTSQEVKLINVPQQPSGFLGNLSRTLGANSVYYIGTQSHSFLSHICFTGNSTVISQLFGSTSVSNVSLLYISLRNTNVAVETLNVSHYVTQYVTVVAIIWVFGVIYMVSIFRRASLKRRK